MHELYNFLTGPLAWLSFILFIGGSLYRLYSMAHLAKMKDPVVYEYMDLYYASRSIFHWIIPFRSENMKNNPVMTVVTFLFHFCLMLTPIFLLAHIMLWKETWNVSWWFLPDNIADIMTLIVIGACIYFGARRVMLPEVRYLTSRSDFIILGIVAAPFITGFWTYHQWGGHQWMLLLHILSGEIMLAAIPFTRLSHMIFFVFTRGYMGSEFGAVRHAKDW